MDVHHGYELCPKGGSWKKNPSPFFKVMAKHHRMSEVLEKGATSTKETEGSLEKSRKLLSIVWVESSWMLE